MSDYILELAAALERHMPEGDINYWMELIMMDNKVAHMAVQFLEEDNKREMDS